jgi:hypothetical protein
MSHKCSVLALDEILDSTSRLLSSELRTGWLQRLYKSEDTMSKYDDLDDDLLDDDLDD